MTEEDLKKRIKELEHQIKELNDLLYQKETLLKEIYSSKHGDSGNYTVVFSVSNRRGERD